MWRIYSLDGLLFVLHRLTGLVLLVFLITHIWAVSTALLGGAAMFDAVMSVLARPGFFIVELLLFGCVIFHAANGLRLILRERGMLAGGGNALAGTAAALTLAVWIGAGVYAARL